MMPISGADTGVVQPLMTAEKARGASEVQKPPEETQGRPLNPVMDEYIRSEPQEPSGRYWIDRDGDGQPKIYFDDRSQVEEAPKQPEAGAPEAADQANQGAKGPEKKDGKEERWKCNTDKADREIEKLKKKQQELEQRLSTETDEAKIKDLERQLAQVERELKQKDNDAYRGRHASFTQLS